MKCYKVVQVRNSLVSAYAYGHATVEYIPGVAVEAPRYLARLKYHLMAFDTYKTALDYYRGFDFGDSPGDLQIWEALGEDFVEIPARYVGLWYDSKHAAVKPTEATVFPIGTLMFKRITLIERVK